MIDQHQIEQLETDGVPIYGRHPDAPAVESGDFLIDGWELDKQKQCAEGTESARA